MAPYEPCRPGSARHGHPPLAAPLLALAAWACVAAGCAAVRAPEIPTGPHFSVLTYNVHFAAPHAERTLEVLRSADSDLVVLQEASAAWQPLLEARLAQRYPHIEVRPHARRGGLAVLSKWPFRTVAHLRSEEGIYGGWTVLVETSLGPVQVLNVHLPATLNDAGYLTPYAFLTRARHRLRLIAEYYGRLDLRWPTLILGDFNAQSSGLALEFLTERGFINALPRFDLTTPTCTGWVGPVPFSLRFDHIVHSRDLYCFDARVLPEGGSDHRAVTAFFGRPPRGE